MPGEIVTGSVEPSGNPGTPKVKVNRYEVSNPSDGRTITTKKSANVYHLAKSKAEVASCGVEQTFLGVHTSPVDHGLAKHLGLPDGFYQSVEFVAEKSPAAKAGLKAHDILQKLDDQIIVNFDQLHALVRSKKAGSEVKLTVLRKGKETQLTAKLEAKVLADVPPSGADGSAYYGYLPTPDGKKMELSFHPGIPEDLPEEVSKHVEEEMRKGWGTRAACAQEGGTELFRTPAKGHPGGGAQTHSRATTKGHARRSAQTHRGAVEKEL